MATNEGWRKEGRRSGTIEERYGVRKGWKFYRCKFCKACVCAICFGHLLLKNDREWIHVPDCADMPKHEHEPTAVIVKHETP